MLWPEEAEPKGEYKLVSDSWPEARDRAGERGCAGSGLGEPGGNWEKSEGQRKAWGSAQGNNTQEKN